MTTMEECLACGEQAQVEVLQAYDDDLLGIPVLLRNAVIRTTCPACGEETTEIPDMDSLVAAVAMARALCPVQLSGAEVRFLRKATGMLAREFAEAIELDAASLSRWENEKQTLGGHAEKVLRLFVCEQLHEAAPAVTYSAAMIPRLRLVARSVLGDPRIVMDRVRFKDRRDEPATLQWEHEPQAA
jgi:DNA-binding transcriptional regulator YiaG